MKRILIISTLDTKGVETLCLRDKIKELGKQPVVLDISMRSAQGFTPDIPPGKVAEAAGTSIDAIHASSDRSKNTALMTTGASAIALGMWRNGALHGIIGLGGSTGSLMATDVMRALPFGVPKVMISSTAALPGMSTRYIGTGDIALFHSVVEISGVTEILKNVIDRAAHAICAMAEVVPLQTSAEKGTRRRTIALTMLGPCERCASSVRTALEEKEYQVTGFSAVGIGDRAMEAMVAQGLFDGVIDLSPSGVIEHLVGGMKDAGPGRMEAAGTMGIPQVISTCGVNHITPPKSKYTDDHKGRRKYDLDKFRTWLRASPEELIKAAGAFAEKLNKAKGPVRVVVPLKGWSSVDWPGNETYDPDEDRIFITHLRQMIKPDIEVIEIAANMEESEFAQAIVDASLELFSS